MSNRKEVMEEVHQLKTEGENEAKENRMTKNREREYRERQRRRHK